MPREPGKRIAMINNGGNPTYYVEDLLGTSRVITTNAGVVCYDSDFYPFGGERSYTNTCPQNYKFEGKERDTETGNDDFGARYYSNRFGRWLSADWSAVPAPVPYANLANPQTLNLYAMVSDDPESFADLDGHTPISYMGALPPVGCTMNACSYQEYNYGFRGGNEGMLTAGPVEPDILAEMQAVAAVQQAQNQSQSSGCGWCQRLVNRLRGAGWKTDQEIAQEAIDRGEPPNGEYSFTTGRSCPDCKYYPKEVVEAVNAHEDQHAKDEHTPSGFGKLFSKSGRRELEVNAFKAELDVENRNIKKLEGIGSRTQLQEKTLTILRNMRDQAIGVIQNPNAYVP